MGLKTSGRAIGNTNNLTTGMDFKKLQTFANDIGFDVKAIIKKIDSTDNLQKKLNECWQGASRDAFVKDLNESMNDLKAAIRAEYADFMSRLQDLANNMYKQDTMMYRQ